MAVQTLAGRSRSTRKFSHAAAPFTVAIWKGRAAPSLPELIDSGSICRAAKPSRLEQAEDRLLAQAIDQHSHGEAALEGALDDMAMLSAEVRDSRRRPLLLRSTTSLNRVEDLLLAAIVRTHPNCEHALDRLLGDISGDDSAAAAARERARAEFDMTIDNDFDGMA